MKKKLVKWSVIYIYISLIKIKRKIYIEISIISAIQKIKIKINK